MMRGGGSRSVCVAAGGELEVIERFLRPWLMTHVPYSSLGESSGVFVYAVAALPGCVLQRRMPYSSPLKD